MNLFKVLNQLKYILILFLFVMISIGALLSYNNTKNIIYEKYDQYYKIIEMNLYNHAENINDTYKFAEEKLNEQMRKYSQWMLEQYSLDNDFDNWDMSEVYTEGYTLNVFDQDLEIIYSSNEENLGFKVADYPSSYQEMKTWFDSDGIVLDKMDLSVSSGYLIKYSYVVTPDKKYILVLIIDLNKKYKELEIGDIYSEAESIDEESSLTQGIKYYKFDEESSTIYSLEAGKPWNSDISEEEKEAVSSVYHEKERESYQKNSDGVSYTYVFFPLQFSQTDQPEWWSNIIIGIVYNNESLINDLRQNKRFLIIDLMGLSFLFILFFASARYLFGRLERLAYHDKLTGLANRERFYSDMATYMNKEHQIGHLMAIMFVDINKFKSINDTYGHDIGDILIQETATYLKKRLRNSDYISRIGGDEFVLGIVNLNSMKEVENIGRRLVQSFDEPMAIENMSLKVTVSVGISLYPKDGKELHGLLKKADSAMYKAKKKSSHMSIYEADETID